MKREIAIFKSVELSANQLFLNVLVLILLTGHPLVQNEKCLHAFLLQDKIDKEGFVPGKVAR